MPDIEKLPKWAQQKIAHLERRVSEAESALEERNNSQEGTNTFYQDYVHGDFGLPRDAAVAFEFDAFGKNKVHARLKDGYLEIMASGHGANALQVQPQSSNVVKVSIGEWL